MVAVMAGGGWPLELVRTDIIVVCNENLSMAMESLWDTSDPKLAHGHFF